MEEIIELLKEIKDHQMQTVQLARTTKVYKLADKALSKALNMHIVVVTSCGCNRPRYLDKKDVLRCVGCDKKSIIL